MNSILLTGCNGQVGWELQRTLAPLGRVTAIDRNALDLADADSIRAVLSEVRPRIIVNAAAYTAVDQAENEATQALLVNGQAPGVMAEEAKRLGALLVHFSTDYVFDGNKNGCYVEQDVTNPLNTYGRTKLAGELAIQSSGCRYLIFRTCWVYGLRGKNFLRTILRLAETKDELRIVADQCGAPTWSRMIAEATAAALATRTVAEGLFHLASTGSVSWHGFTQAILELTEQMRLRNPTLTAIPSSDYPQSAVRPLNSRLSCDLLEQAAGIRLPDWKDALRLCLGGAATA
ncbi:MAG: dTDP-4-dehydrorhamnose reductase [Betaproteobacteria bacterium]|nr:dTDP-4-dehydrorhamnose reductase [Betaproteobacteria bacterium]